MQEELIPLNDRILIEPLDSVTAGGIVLTHNNDQQRAKVLAVGAGRNMPSGRIPIDVKVGDIVVYGDVNNTIKEELNGKPVLLITEMAVVAIVKEVL